MFLEKIKQHAGKIAFFVINLLAIASGALYLKQKSLEDSVKKAIAEDLAKSKASQQLGDAAQKQIEEDASIKKASVSENTGTVTRQQNTTVTKTIPAVTQTVTTTKPAASTPKATTKKS